jgi:natural product biosynthesis luciferase-like monooxygenase protein
VLSEVGLAVNFHDGPLPEYAGLAVTSWSIFHGETEHAVTWHTMTAEVDAGEVVVTERFEIAPDETAFSLNARCYEHALDTFPHVLRAVAGVERVFTPQPDRPGSWFGRYQRPVAVVDPTQPAVELDRAVRALALGPRIRNRVGVVRLVVGDDVLVVGATDVVAASTDPASPSNRHSGDVIATDRGVRITGPDGDLLITEATTAVGDELGIDQLRMRLGHSLEPVRQDLVAALRAADEGLARHETFWTSRLASFERSTPTHLASLLTSGPTGDDAGHGAVEVEVSVPSDADPAEIAAGVASWWSRTSGVPTTWFDLADQRIDATVDALDPLVQRPVGRVVVTDESTGRTMRAAMASELDELGGRGPFLRDLVARTPLLRHRRIEPALRIHVGPGRFDRTRPDRAAARLDAVIDPAGGALRLRVRSGSPDALDVTRRCAEQIATLLVAARDQPDEPVANLALVGPTEQAAIDQWNRTELAFDRDATVDSQFRARAARTPHLPAVTCSGSTLSYDELQQAVEAFAQRLTEAGATPHSLVGIALERDIDLLVAVLAVLTVGAAYVPLDPGYPQERLTFMVADSGLAVLVADAATGARLADGRVTVVAPDAAGTNGAPLDGRALPTGDIGDFGDRRSSDLAYVIYTSGSTGQPKGVMLEHRNVVNFFAAMDEVIEHDPPGTWLAVTSLSFDISVLELLWTVTRGLHVVIQKHGITSGVAPGATTSASASLRPAVSTSSRATSLSLFFFAAGESQASDGYRLLRESAQFADANGFEAIWLPERHFHAFGGAYPNPSVLASAVAALTTKICVRAGSVVLPLHSSARVAEEWAVVDNLSGGRVGISFAPGWQPNDFVLNPSGFATARDDLQQRIDEVRALWRGDAVDMIGPDDRVVSVRTLPRPVQPELPVWLTSAGTTKTFEKAGEMGLNLLTHLLGQSPEQLAANIEVYRTAWAAAGHAGRGHITVMLHTFLHHDRTHAKALAEQPMKQYLGSATGLLKNMASAFPTFANSGASADEAFRSLTDTEMDELLTVAAARYLDTSGLFGNVDDAAEMALTLSAMGVDELACLVDFGIDTDQVLGSLSLLGELNEVLQRAAVPDDAPGETGHSDTASSDVVSEEFADLVARHAVTHVQCTPSLAAMLMADPRDRAALGDIRHLMVGGEALPEKLAKELRTAVTGRLTNMYGPTETTIWSLVHELDTAPVGPVPIGRAIGNTSLHVLDAAGVVVPVGVLGELHIGGEGVARGYLGRDQLTAQRFVERPGMGRVYATGDLVRLGDGGVVEFGGRVDFQVKIRGHRIELGEIEAQLDLHPSVERSVVVARGEAADARLIAFVVPAAHNDIDMQLLRKHVGSVLPDVMVPDVVVAIGALPLTPNGKVDRAALPTEVDRNPVVDRKTELVAPSDGFERLVADAWTEQLNRPVGRTDNFFDLGGHSLLAVAVFRTLQEATGLRIALTDVFRYPTVAGFAAYLEQLGGPSDPSAPAASSTPNTGVDRGARRRQLLERRRGSGPSDREPSR